MGDAISKRMGALQSRFSMVLREASEHEARASALRQELLRIEGALKVLEEMRSETKAAEAAEATAPTGDES